ncbi:MAG: hypothetical protein PF542_06875 [Nanoarchaeota archaeon]|jgi:tRNA(Leu) C34 or U34 (ribose-2'-O)-methylase TrmL|nr:hypothetical protein [Nanoarchaeota archaeon]
MDYLLYGTEKAANLGSIIRTAASFGIYKIYLFDKQELMKEEDSLRRMKDVSMGHFDEVEICVVDDLDVFLKKYENVYSTTLRKGAKKLGVDEYDLKFEKDGLIIFGAETRGIPRELCRFENVVIPTIGMSHCLSLPMAFGIVLYECLRQSQGFPLRGRN